MVFFHFIQILKVTPVCNSGDPGQTPRLPRFAASGLVLCCLPMSHKRTNAYMGLDYAQPANV